MAGDHPFDGGNNMGPLEEPVNLNDVPQGFTDGMSMDEIDAKGRRCCSSSPVSEGSALDCDFLVGSSKRMASRTDDSTLQAENSAAYFLWPPAYRLHGSAIERTAYFFGQHKIVNSAISERAPSGPQAATLLDLMTIRAYHSKQLRRVSVGTAVGFRTKNGVLTDIPAIIVFVARKVHKAWLQPGQELPMHLEGPGGVWCDVDVVEFAYHSTPGFTPKEQVYTELVEGLRGNDPCIGPGSQVASQETYGTLGAIVQSRTGACQVGFLTNRHVAVDLDYPNQKMYHPLPPNCGPGIYLGAVERATSYITDERWYNIFASVNPETFVRADGAFIPFGDGFDMTRVITTVKGLGNMGEAKFIDLLAPVGTIVGKQVMKVGRSTGLTKGRIMAYALEYNDERGICYFTDFLIVGENKQPFDLEGDSGSLILMVEEGSVLPRPVGMIWGGVANRGRLKLQNGYGPENWTSAVDLGRLLERLQLDLITTDTALADAILKQHQLAMGSVIPGECLSRPLAIYHPVEVNQHVAYKAPRTKFRKRVHRLGQGELGHQEDHDHFDIDRGWTLVNPLEADVESNDIMKQDDPRVQTEGNMGFESCEQTMCNDDHMCGLRLYDTPNAYTKQRWL